MTALHEWFTVRFDASEIELQVQPPNGHPWHEQIPWPHIIRVCFRAGDWLESDEIYVFTNQRPESYVIPTAAAGGAELWIEIIRRKLFDADLAIAAASATDELFCWPPESEE